VLLFGERTLGTVISSGGALSPTDGRYAYSAVVEFTPPGQAPQRIQRGLSGRLTIERLPLTRQWWGRLDTGESVRVAYRSNAPDRAELLHPHARWAGAAALLAVGVLLLAMSLAGPSSRRAVRT
jgi:hypothetical protein